MRLPMKVLLAAAGLVGLSLAPVAAADLFATDWAASAKSRARLIADGVSGVGFEIELAPGAITYWRDPGEAGVPPTFDFSGSGNLASAEVLFPAPSRIAEPDGSTANGYQQQTIFPIRVAAVDPRKPIALKVHANYAVCEKICLPARAILSLELPSGVAGPHGAALASAASRVPAKAALADLGGAVKPIDARSWRLCFKASADDKRELFVEAPSGVWLEARSTAAEAGRTCYLLSLQEAPTAPMPVVATLVGAASAVETSFELPKP